MTAQPKTIPDVIRLNAATTPEKVWGRFAIDGRDLTFAEIERLGTLIAGGLRKDGIGKGDRVAVMLDNVSEFTLAWFGLAFAGAVMVPINTFFKSLECGYILHHAGVKGVVCASTYLDVIESAAPAGAIVWSVDGGARPFEELLHSRAGRLPAVDESDAAGILYTSGTTGNPKGCIESHRFYLRAGSSFRDVVHLKATDVVLTPLPLFHANPQIIAVMGSLMAGAAVAVLDRFHPSTLIERCRQFNATILCYLGVMPAMMMNLPQAPGDRAHTLRLGLGAAIPPRLHAAFEERFGFPMIEAYGMSEAGNATMVDPDGPRMVGSGTCGRLCPDVQARIVDGAGRDLEAGQPGELLLKGPSLFSGYFADEAANREAFDSAGWFRTGDMLRVDASGNYYFIDRIRDVIRRSGENISVIEVETVLRTHPAVGDVAVIGVPDDVRGQELKACIVLKQDLSRDEVSPEEIADFASARLAYFKVPRLYKYYGEFPQTPTLKVRKFQLRSEAGDLAAGCWDRLTKSWRSSMSALPECIETFRQGWLKEDIELVKKSITADMVYVDPFGSYDGAEAMVKYCVASFRRFRDYSMDITRFAVTGNTVAVEWSFKMTGDVGSIKDKRVELVGAGILELRDGKIRSWHDYWDSVQMARQLGIDDVHQLRG